VTVTFLPVRIATGSSDEHGCLAFVDDRLVAVLVRLSDAHAEAAGRWFLECGFGPLNEPAAPTFTDLDDARGWLVSRLAQAQHASAESGR
jgi:hypothetical protein